MGRITDSLVEILTPLGGVRVTRVIIGLYYTAVQLADGRGGVAFTFRDLAGKGCPVHMGPRPLAGRLAEELLPCLTLADPILAAVGLATANALAPDHPGEKSGDVLAHLDLRPDDRVGMVGDFRPVLPALRKRVGQVAVFERVQFPQDGLLPYEQAFDLLPQCQVAVVSGTTVLNGTLEPLLEAAANCREVVILGASTPMTPEAFAGTPVSVLSGVKVTHTEELVQVVAEGGGMHQFKGLIDKLYLSLS
ncbi:MAG: DUF364 domain-containing protein [Deltaproteobacteria bacterium]|nr:DUF364 domain-containing protein [Deltaproteobacteria bacterium]